MLLAPRVLTVHTPIAVAAATLAAAALFTPVRRRVQHIVDRRFNRARYDADRTVAAFSARLQGVPSNWRRSRPTWPPPCRPHWSQRTCRSGSPAPAGDRAAAQQLARGGLAGPVGRDVQPVPAPAAVAVAP